MILEEIIKFIDDKIPQELALKNDKIGFTQKYDLNQNIESIKIMMDLLPKDDEKLNKETLVITHHPPIYPNLISHRHPFHDSRPEMSN